MYPYSLYRAFVALRKQLYRIKSQRELSKYDQIELHKQKFKSFRGFCNEADSFIYDFEKDSTVQEIFDDMLEKSQTKY